jgi:hypothetical protein
VYHSFPEQKTSDRQALPIRFKRLHHDLFTHFVSVTDSQLDENESPNSERPVQPRTPDQPIELDAALGKRKRQGSPSRATEKQPHPSSSRSELDRKRQRPIEQIAEDKVVARAPYHRRLRHFDDVGGRSGTFICGQKPGWAICHRGFLRFFPMRIDAPVTCFSPFHHPNCQRGFVYFNQAVSSLSHIYIRLLI